MLSLGYKNPQEGIAENRAKIFIFNLTSHITFNSYITWISILLVDEHPHSQYHFDPAEISQNKEYSG